MAHSDDLQQTFSDICLLYELALAVGDSLDIRHNCERVLTTLVARKAFSYGAVWLRTDRLPNHADKSERPQGLELVYGAPRSQVRDMCVPENHPMWQRALAEQAFSVLHDDPEFAELVTERDVERGALSIFALGDLGLVKLYARTARQPLSEVEISQLVTIMKKFTTSLEGCLAHAGIVHEIAERERAELERRAVQQQLQQAQKMEAVGRLAGGIAHDFNNLLVAVLGNAELLSRDARDTAVVQKGLAAIATAARRAADLTAQLLAFSRTSQLKATPLVLDDLVSEVVGLLSRTIDPKIRVETDLHLPGVCVVGEPAQLHTVLLNLALNARDAMPSGGVLRFVSGRVSDADSGGAERVEVSVQDTGEGMPAEIADRVFEPFFTTKELGQGTGLGLAAAYGIVQSHGGEICVESQLERGSTFRIRLPVAPATLLMNRGERSQELYRGQGLALLVDDDTNARRTIAQMLQRLGFDVMEACNGREALAALADSHAVDLMLLDLKMPVLDGVGTLRELPTEARQVPIIAISGYADEEHRRALPGLGVAHVLQKPFSLAELSSMVAERLCASN